MLDPIRVIVCARKEGCGVPDAKALDQYMPEAGAAGTSGASFGFWRGGKAVCVPCVRAVALVVRRLITGGVACDAPELTIADVDRIADGRLAMISSPSREASL
jgi:hypothetical protein